MPEVLQTAGQAKVNQNLNKRINYSHSNVMMNVLSNVMMNVLSNVIMNVLSNVLMNVVSNVTMNVLLCSIFCL